MGVPSTYWFDRALTQNLYLYPVPDGAAAYTLNYYRFRSTQDAKLSTQGQLAIPTRWMMAFSDAMALELAFTYRPEAAPALAVKLNGDGNRIEGSYSRARKAEREDVAIYIAPALSSYFE